MVSVIIIPWGPREMGKSAFWYATWALYMNMGFRGGFLQGWLDPMLWQASTSSMTLGLLGIQSGREQWVLRPAHLIGVAGDPWGVKAHRNATSFVFSVLLHGTVVAWGFSNT